MERAEQIAKNVDSPLSSDSEDNYEDVNFEFA